ncbi:MAG: GrpB family protein [Gemmatimonadaceae bacterium]
MTEPLGLESKTVRVVPYDVRWAALFRAEASRLSDAVLVAGLPALRFEHVGSTAVPGLAAKPILDIAAGRAMETRAVEYVPAFEAAGYIYRGESGLPGREFFRRGDPRSYHLHFVDYDGWHWRRYITFRNALRADARLRDSYAAVKYDLAAKYPHDRESYIEGKTGFVESVLNAALDQPA